MSPSASRTGRRRHVNTSRPGDAPGTRSRASHRSGFGAVERDAVETTHDAANLPTGLTGFNRHVFDHRLFGTLEIAPAWAGRARSATPGRGINHLASGATARTRRKHERDHPRRHPVRVDGPARDRRHRRRVEEAPRHARAGDPDAEPDRARPAGGAAARRETRPMRRARRSSSPVDGPAFSEILAGKSSVAVIIDNQFRPDAVLEAAAARVRRDRGRGITDVRVVCANGKVFPMSESDMEQKLGRREPRAHGAERLGVLPERPAERGGVHVRRRLLRRHAGLAAQRGRTLEREDHHRPGPGEPLGRGRRRQADPARRRLGRDDRVEPLRVRHRRRRRTTARTPGRCARTSTRSRRCAGSTAR